MFSFANADGSTLVKALQGAAAAAVLSADKVLWLPGESGRRNVTVHLSQPPVSQPPGGLLVTVGNVSNADLSLEQSSTVISDIPFANLTTEFAVIPNQVCLRLQQNCPLSGVQHFGLSTR